MKLTKKEKLKLSHWCHRLSREMNEDEILKFFPRALLNKISDTANAKQAEILNKQMLRELKDARLKIVQSRKMMIKASEKIKKIKLLKEK